MNLNRRLLLLACVLAFAGGAAAQNESLSGIFTNATMTSRMHRITVPRRPSIVFIDCHGLALGDLSCYGQTNFQTPNIDRLAALGMRFTDYSVASDDLAQSQAALVTGGVDTSLSAGHDTVATRLHAAGYHTGLIGEWLLGQEPWTQGFDEFAGFFTEQEANNYYSDFVRRYAPKSIINETNHTFDTYVGAEEIYPNTGGKKGTFIPDLLMLAAGNFAAQNVPDRANLFRPFFLLVDLPFPHTVTPGKDDYPVPTDAPFTGEDWPQAAKNRAALMTRFDDQVGKLVEHLHKLGLTNNVAIFLAGAVAPEKFADKNMNFLQVPGEVRGGGTPARLRVPLIAYWPDHIPAGKVSSARRTSADFAPTAIALADVKFTSTYKGVSILPTLLGNTKTNAP